MNTQKPNSVHRFVPGLLPTIFLFGPLTAMALEQAECENRLQSVDERIASGEYPPNNVQIAQQMRASIMQSCAHLTDATLEPMLEGFEQLLPTRTKAEQQAYEEAKREQRRAENEATRAERDAGRRRREQAEAAVVQLPVSAALTKPPTGRATSTVVDRPNDMHSLRLIDWDVHNERGRILYRSSPDAGQESQASAKKQYYVVLAAHDGTFAQHEIASTPVRSLTQAGLRRGFDEVIFQHAGEDVQPLQSTIVRRSIPLGDDLSTAAAPALEWGARARNWNEGSSLLFRQVLSDGNLLFAGNPNRANDVNAQAVGWASVSPNGSILEKGSYDRGLFTSIAEYADSEKASILINHTAASNSTGAFEMDTTYDARGRFIVLVNKITRPSKDPLNDGRWLLEYSAGNLVQKTHLQGDDDYLKTTSTMIASSPSGKIYIYAYNSRKTTGYVMQLSLERKVTAYSEATYNQSQAPEAMVADDQGAWLAWRLFDDDRKQLFRLERVRFD